MRKILIFSLSFIFLASGCGRVKLTENPIFDKSVPASPCILESDTTSILVSDYFPALRDREALDVVIDGSAAPFITLMEVREGEQKGVVVVFNRTPSKSEGLMREKAPRITTLKGEDECSFYIKVENGATEEVVLWQNTEMEKDKGITVIDSATLRITVPVNANSMERSYIRAYMANENGIGNDILVPVCYGKVMLEASALTREDKHAMVLYSLMIDRFVDGDTTNDMPLNSPLVHHKVDYWGGDLAGVIQTLEKGYFDTLGINTIWLSPITQNPFNAWGQIHDPETKFSGYHGYWPYFATKVDVRYGSEDQLRELLDKAHADGKNVILDYVSNHMHIESPTLTAHPDWTTPSLTPDGRPNRQLYDEFRLTTWFDDHIPTLDLERPEICAQMSDSALYWLKNFEFDGFRHDATKHIPENYWRMLTAKIMDSIDRSVYQIGETYGSLALISSYVKPGMLDAQFDFNVYDTFIWATVDSDGSFTGLERRIVEDLDCYGYHNLMGNITGNHDRPRYISLASGDVSRSEDDKLAGWHRDITVTDRLGYDKLKMLHAMNFTLPGVPCIYYGDEYGQPGANDPDNRRWMRFDDLDGEETSVMNCVKELSSLRRSSMPLIYGDFFPLAVSDHLFAYMRCYMGEYVAVFFNDFDETRTITATLPFGYEHNGSSDVVITLQPHSFQIIK